MLVDLVHSISNLYCSVQSAFPDTVQAWWIACLGDEGVPTSTIMRVAVFRAVHFAVLIVRKTAEKGYHKTNNSTARILALF